MTEKPESEEPLDKHPESFDFPPERPLECSECKKPIAVHYTNITGKNVTHTLMCADCPFLQQHLKGIPVHPTPSLQSGPETGLCCGNCGTTLESIRMGNTVGCSACYEVFSDVLVAELQASSKIPSHTPTNKKTVTYHLGRGPGETSELNPSVKLLVLNEALNETLKLEDYEQAAWIRDQIKEITEKSAAQKEAKKNSGRSGEGNKGKEKEKGNSDER